MSMGRGGAGASQMSPDQLRTAVSPQMASGCRGLKWRRWSKPCGQMGAVCPPGRRQWTASSGGGRSVHQVTGAHLVSGAQDSVQMRPGGAALSCQHWGASCSPEPGPAGTAAGAWGAIPGTKARRTQEGTWGGGRMRDLDRGAVWGRTRVSREARWGGGRPRRSWLQQGSCYAHDSSPPSRSPLPGSRRPRSPRPPSTRTPASSRPGSLCNCRAGGFSSGCRGSPTAGPGP